MNVFKILLVVLLATVVTACSDDSDRHVDPCTISGIEAIVFMQNDPRKCVRFELIDQGKTLHR